jgi:two-component system KDP operon response regulator KdpE
LNKTTILVVDDEASIRKLLRITLEAASYRVVEAIDGREGLHLIAADRPSIVLLDMGLPDKRGNEILKDLRGWNNVPVVILSVENDPATIVEALDLGADDYLTKPFRTDELMARIRVCLRRSLLEKSAEPRLTIKDIEIDLEKRIVKKSGVEVHLTSIEYDYLIFMLKNRGKVVTQSQILKVVWGPHVSSDSSYPRVYMRHLRQKLEAKPDEPEIFLTEIGVGYRLIE